MNVDDFEYVAWTWRDNAWVRWIQMRAWFRRCPDCRRRGYYPDTPRWDEDKTARMLGLPVEGHCPNCGKRDVGRYV